MIGRNIESGNRYLSNFIKEKGRKANFKLMGEQRDMHNLMYCMDIFCLSSISEGFPNVVAEAMLMYTPCVVTDVGDAKRIVGTIGEVVPIRQPIEMSNALLKLTSLTDNKRHQIGKRARARIKRLYNIENINKSYMSEYAIHDQKQR